MYGIVLLAPQEKGKRRAALRCGTKTICGVRFFAVSAEQSHSKVMQMRTLRKAARAMERAGVRTALFPPAFAHAALFERRGIRAADESYLRRMTAGAVARRVLADHGKRAAECRVAVLGDHMSAEVRKALMELALHVRYTMLSAGGGGGEICSVLRREYGVSVLRDPGQEQLRRADLVLTFGKAAPCGAEGVPLAALRRGAAGGAVYGCGPCRALRRAAGGGGTGGYRLRPECAFQRSAGDGRTARK